MNFKRTDDALAICRAHVDATGTRGTPVESYLVGYVLVVACSEFEQRFRDLVNKRCSRHPDVDLVGFMSGAVFRLFRSPDIEEMGKLLERFGKPCKQQFVASRTPGVETSYGNVVANRHTIAHGAGSNMTFAEAESTIKASYQVFDAVAAALGLTAAELTDFT